MKLSFSIPKPDSSQKKLMSLVAADLGKLFFAAGVVGYFVPALITKISVFSFILALVASLFFISLGVVLAKKPKAPTPLPFPTL